MNVRFPFGQITELAMIYLTAFIIVAFAYAFLAAFTALFYKKKREAECTYVEKLIRTGKASFGQRVTLFWQSVFGSMVVLQCYIYAAVITAVYWFVYL